MCYNDASEFCHNYELNNHTLTVTDRHTQLGVNLDKHLSYVSEIIGKASGTLSFLKRNLNNCSTDVKAA